MFLYTGCDYLSRTSKGGNRIFYDEKIMDYIDKNACSGAIVALMSAI